MSSTTGIRTNYHTHTLFCDGKAEAVCFVEEAVRKNLSAIGFSAHAPVTFPTGWTINPLRVGEYHKEIHRLKNEYDGRPEIYCGLEADYFPDIFEDVQALYSGYQWDYIIGSIHFIGVYPNGQRWCIDGPHEDFLQGWIEIAGSDPLLPILRYFEYTREMVRVMKPDIIGHMDKIKIQYRPGCLVPETHPVYREQVMNTLEEIASSGCMVEINTRGIFKGQTDDFYPSRWVIEEMYKMHIPVTISSDAHTPDGLVAGFEQAEKTLKETGYKTIRVLKNNQWQERPL